MYQCVQQLQEVQGDQVCLGDLQYLDMLSHIWVILNEINAAVKKLYRSVQLLAWIYQYAFIWLVVLLPQ